MLRCKSSAAFTIIELIVAMSIGGILMLLAYAPYSFYADKARVTLSAEKIEQIIDKARLLSTTGYTFWSTGKNADLGVYMKKDSKNVEMRTLRSGTSDLSLGNDTLLLETVRLEDRVEISALGNAPGDSEIMIVFRAPSGKREIKSLSGPSSASGGTVGYKWLTTWALSKHFVIP